MIYRVEVDYSTHDLLKEGIIIEGTMYLTFLAKDDHDAMLGACQIVAGQHKMPTAARMII